MSSEPLLPSESMNTQEIPPSSPSESDIESGLGSAVSSTVSSPTGPESEAASGFGSELTGEKSTPTASDIASVPLTTTTTTTTTSEEEREKEDSYYQGESYNPWFMIVNYIPQADLPKLKSHTYSGIEVSILKRLFLGSYWTWVHSKLPIWVSPNVVTTLGFVCVAATLFLFGLSDLDAVLPRWVYFLSGCLVWTYQTLDAIDGKQARATGIASPFGEILDHGMDSLTIWILAVITVHLFGVGHSLLGVATTMALCAGFIFATWEEYNTHTLYLGVINGPDEGLVTISGLLVATAFIGPEFWFSESPALGLTYGQLMAWGTILGSFYAIATNIHAVATKSRIELGFIPSLILVLTPVVTWYASWYWVADATELWEDNPRLALIVLGIYVSYMTMRMLLCHIIQRTFSAIVYSLAGLLVSATHVALVEYLSFSPASAALLIIAAIALAVIHFVVSVALRVSHYLRIPLLSVPLSMQRRAKLAKATGASLAPPPSV